MSDIELEYPDSPEENCSGNTGKKLASKIEIWAKENGLTCWVGDVAIRAEFPRVARRFIDEVHVVISSEQNDAFLDDLTSTIEDQNTRLVIGGKSR